MIRNFDLEHLTANHPFFDPAPGEVPDKYFIDGVFNRIAYRNDIYSKLYHGNDDFPF